MQTQVINSSDINTYVSAIAEAGRALREGALVVFPTETVYGIAANAAAPEATRRLREFKGSKDRRPFTVHLAGRSAARQYVNSPSPVLRRLARKAWPGPLTLIAEESRPEETEIARSCPAGQLGEIFYEGTVGLRCPDHGVAQRLLGEADVPVVASSANGPGRAPPLDVEDALRDCEGKVEYALDGRRTRFNGASTVVQVQGNTWKVVRAGPVDERMLRRYARSLVLFVCTGNLCRSPMAEGLFRHRLVEELRCTPEELSAAGYEVASAGTCALPDGQASSGSIEEMAQRGIDITGHRSQPLKVEVIQEAERIYVMSSEHRSAVLDLAPGAAERLEMFDPDGPVQDPIGGGTEEYRRCAAHVEHVMAVRLKEFLNEDRDW